LCHDRTLVADSAKFAFASVSKPCRPHFFAATAAGLCGRVGCKLYSVSCISSLPACAVARPHGPSTTATPVGPPGRRMSLARVRATLSIPIPYPRLSCGDDIAAWDVWKPALPLAGLWPPHRPDPTAHFRYFPSKRYLINRQQAKESGVSLWLAFRCRSYACCAPVDPRSLSQREFAETSEGTWKSIPPSIIALRCFAFAIRDRCRSEQHQPLIAANGARLRASWGVPGPSPGK